MDNILLGIIFGLAFGVLDIVIMVPLKFDDNRKRLEAMTAAFLERFAIGFLIPNVQLGAHPVITGLILGLGLSLPSAIITRIYAPIVGIGVVGGIVIGYLVTLM